MNTLFNVYPDIIQSMIEEDMEDEIREIREKHPKKRQWVRK